MLPFAWRAAWRAALGRRADPDHLIVSALFGTGFSTVYPAIPGRPCVFLSNNPALAGEARRQGWRFELVPGLPLDASSKVSSVQSKYVKFLRFLRDMPHLAAPRITYHDHKFFVREEHVAWIEAHADPSRAILIRETPKAKLSLQEEIDAAMPDARYASSMERTRAWIAEQKRDFGVIEAARIANTGLMHVRDIARAAPLLDEVYEAVLRLDQPECQIIWAVVAQKHPGLVQLIPWRDLEPLWQVPPPRLTPGLVLRKLRARLPGAPAPG